ncbi:hypothetical protein ACOMHN_005615 [Nucella lapillus]
MQSITPVGVEEDPSSPNPNLPLSGEDDTSDEEPAPPADGDSPSECEEEEEEQVEEELEEDVGNAGVENAKDGTQWAKTPPVQVGRTPARNVYRPPPTQIPGCNNVNHPLDAFQLFITSKIICDLVKFTNIEGIRVLHSAWLLTDAGEMMAFLGLLLFLGCRKQNFVCTEDLWNMTYGCGVARACMSRKRFQTLMTYLRFDNKETRNARRQRDAFAPFRDVWEAFMKNLQKHYIPGPLLTIDEQLVPFRGQCSFLQYLPSKPDRYGIKVFWVADAEANYPLYGIPYLGRPAGQDRQINLGRNTVLQLAEPFFKSGRNVTCDNYFTDLILAESLLQNGLTMVGTVRANKRFLPISFKDQRKLCLYDSDFAYNKAVTLLNYQSKRRKSVVALSTMHTTGIVNDTTAKKKPEIILFYNSTKGAVDTLDKMAHAYTVKRKTNRWPMVMFSNIMDLATIAARRIWQIRFPGDPLGNGDARAAFIRTIALEMMVQHIQMRVSEVALPRHLVQTAQKVIADIEGAGHDQLTPRSASKQSKKRQIQELPSVGQKHKDTESAAPERKRCLICPRSKDRKTKQKCAGCNDYICQDHTFRVCPICVNHLQGSQDKA